MKKIFKNQSMSKAASLVSGYKAQGYTFVQMQGRGCPLHLWGTLATKKGTLRHVHIFANFTIKGKRAFVHRLLKPSLNWCKRAYINGHA